MRVVDTAAIAFKGEVVALVSPNACKVRFHNGHVVTAYPADAPPHDAPEAYPMLGQAVCVEMTHREMKGWRWRRP